MTRRSKTTDSSHPTKSAASYRRRVQTRPVESIGDPEARWRSHPWLARLVRWTVFLVPVIVTFLFALAATELLPQATSLWPNVLRWLLIAAASTVVLVILQRLAKRFIPLAALFSLTLVFPDSAPSRFGLALRTGTTRQLKAKIDGVDEDGLGDTPREAAESLLELVAALSRHDRMTRGHSERVRGYARMIGEEMELDEDELDRLHWASLLHDVGKLYVPDEILNKPGELTDEEFAVIKTHPESGQRLVDPLVDWLGPSAAAVWEHHEHWEGGGYPTGIPSEQTALASRIVCVADAFDVMTSARSYKEPATASKARAELERCAGSQFDPHVVRAMMTVSLGKLWGAMGPLSLVTQLRLFPRRLAQGGTAVAAAAIVLVAMLITGIADGLPWSFDDGVSPSVVGVVDGSDDGSGDSGVDSPEPLDSVVSVPTAIVVPSTTSTTTTIVPTTTSISTTSTTTTTTTSTSTTTTSTSTTPTSTSTTTTSTTVAATTPVVPTTTAAPVVVVTTTAPPPPTTIPPATTTTTTTTLPVVPTRLTLASSAAGNVASQPVLDLLVRAPINANLANYDVDRNADPGLTIRRSAGELASSDPSEVQTWRGPSSIELLSSPVRLQLWFAPVADPANGFAVVSAGLYDCAGAGGDCVALAQDAGVFSPVAGSFTGVSFDLTPAGGSYSLAAGRVIEIRVAVPSGSSTDLFVAYDSTPYPATATFG